MNNRNATFTLQDISDRADIEDVLNRYTKALDTKDWALLERVFSQQAEADFSQVGGPPRPVVSSTSIAEVLKATLGTLITQHISSNSLIELSGGTAKVMSYVMAQHWRKSDGLEFVLRGRYTDIFVIEAAGWRIAKRLLQPIHATGDPAMLSS
jgi:3-phenylpropionate/cinnamic acid dioxygenase small subunit